MLNVSGHRLGTAEIENAINSHPDVIESAVVGYPHDIKGVGIYAYITLAEGKHLTEDVKKSIAAVARSAFLAWGFVVFHRRVSPEGSTHYLEPGAADSPGARFLGPPCGFWPGPWYPFWQEVFTPWPYAL